MADLSAITKQMQDLIAPSYQTQQQALTDQFNNQLNQLQQQKAAVPAQYDPQRAAADLRAANAQNSMADYLSNMGYGTGSGLGASKLVDINNAKNNAYNTIGQAQNTAVQNAQNNINTAQTTYGTNSANLTAQEQKDIASASQTEYQNEQQREYEAQQAELARQQQEKLQQEQLAAQAAENEKSRQASIAAAQASAAASVAKAQASATQSQVNQGLSLAKQIFYTKGKFNTTGESAADYLTNHYGNDAANIIMSSMPLSRTMYDKSGNSYQTQTLYDYIVGAAAGLSTIVPRKTVSTRTPY